MVLTEATGQVGIDVPRDRAGTFEPQLVRPPLPAHPGRPDFLRPRPRHRRRSLRQRRPHQGRTSCRDHRLRRLLAAGHRHRSRPAGLRLPADHLQDPRPAVRPRHPLAHPAPARQDRTHPPRRTGRHRVDERRHRPLRPLPPAPPARRPHHAPRHQHPGPPDRGQEHRPRRACPDHHQRPHGARQEPARPLRRADDGRERARRLHRRLFLDGVFTRPGYRTNSAAESS